MKKICFVFCLLVIKVNKNAKKAKNVQFADFGKIPILGPDLAMVNDIV